MKRRAFTLPRLLLLLPLLLIQWKGVSGVVRVQRQAGNGFQQKQDTSHLSYLELVDARRSTLNER